MKVVAFLVGLAVLSALGAVLGFGAAVEGPPEAPGWVEPATLGAAALAVIFGGAAVIQLIVVIYGRYRRER